MGFDAEMRHYLFAKHLNEFYLVWAGAVDVDSGKSCFKVPLN
jgi:hypothetical protein